MLAVWGSAGAQPSPEGPNAVRSASGQFLVFAPSPAPPPAALAAVKSDTNYISLQPALLVVSCERLKQKLWQTLGVTAAWRGRICLDLRRARGANERVVIVKERLRGVWSYRVELPDVLERDRFMRALAHVLLLEIANRGAGSQPAEIPTWLAEGLACELRASSERELLLPPPEINVHGLVIGPQLVNDERRTDPLTRAQQVLRAQPPLSFEQLSWPGDRPLDGVAGEGYRRSAQLFVNQLLRLKNGRSNLQDMLNQLPRRSNWQLAFLAALHDSFGSLLDVEKWWALQGVRFTGRDLTQTWPPDESWRKLDEVIRPPVEIRTGTNQLPLHATVSLQTVLREWDPARQRAALERTCNELGLLRSRVAPEAVPLVDDYTTVIRAYLKKRAGTVSTASTAKPAGPAVDRATEDTIRQLDALEVQREASRPAAPPAVADPAKPASAASSTP
jgi:hypothetical protein